MKLNWENILDVAFDVYCVVMIAALLAFVAYCGAQAGFGVGFGVFAMFLSAYMIGRWHAGKNWERHAGKNWERDMALLRSYYESKRE